jgi:hypothetical protein
VLVETTPTHTQDTPAIRNRTDLFMQSLVAALWDGRCDGERRASF